MEILHEISDVIQKPELEELSEDEEEDVEMKSILIKPVIIPELVKSEFEPPLVKPKKKRRRKREQLVNNPRWFALLNVKRERKTTQKYFN